MNNRYNSRRYDSLRTVRVSVQVTEKEREKLECLARKEGMSIIENLIKLDVWVPSALRNMFEVGIDKTDRLKK